MGAKRKLTRDSDLYTSAMENRIMSESNPETEITSIEQVSVSYDIHWTTTWSNISREGVERNRSRDYVELLRSMSPNKLSIELSGKGKTSHHWTAEMTVKPNVIIQLNLSLPDGEIMSCYHESVISNFKDVKSLHRLVQCIVNENKMNVEINEETVELSKDGNKYKLFKNPSPRGSNNRFYSHYIRNGSRWMKCKLGEPKYMGKTVYFPVYRGDDKLTTIEFDDADTSDEFWEFADTFGYGDPIEAEGEEIYTALMNCTSYSNPNYISHPECVFSTEERRESISWYHRILSLFNDS